MSSGEVRKVSRQDIQLVQNLIECCLQLYMNQKEVVDTLSLQAKIEPSFTELVWQKLEEENREFFKAYNVRLMLKNQIMVFNKLLERQVELMQKPCPTSIDPTSVSNGSMSASWNAPASASPRPNDLLCNGVTSSALANGRSLGQDGLHVVNESSVLNASMERSNSILSAQNSSIGGANEINRTTIKTEPVYSNNSGFPFYTNNIFFEERQPVGDASAGSFRSSEFTTQSIQDPLLDMDTSFGFNQIPRNFSFSDLTDDFTHCADILENYGRSPFLPHEASNFQVSPAKEFTDEESRRLDTISESVSYDEFGSD